MASRNFPHDEPNLREAVPAGLPGLEGPNRAPIPSAEGDKTAMGIVAAAIGVSDTTTGEGRGEDLIISMVAIALLAEPRRTMRLSE